MKKIPLVILSLAVGSIALGWHESGRIRADTLKEEETSDEPKLAGPKDADPEDVEFWEDYNDGREEETAEKIFVKALDQFPVSTDENRLRLLDLGAGAGRDTMEALKRNWHVTALDITPRTLKELAERAKKSRGVLETKLSTFQSMQLPEKSFDLINASYSLPFVKKKEFEKIWPKVTAAIKPGGRFSGTFFGENHAWAKKANAAEKNFHSKEEIIKLIREAGLELEGPIETETIDQEKELDDGKTITIHFEVHHVIARKPK